MERGGFLSALSLSQVLGFILSVWLLGFLFVCFPWGPQLFSGIINIYFKTESVLMMGTCTEMAFTQLTVDL